MMYKSIRFIGCILILTTLQLFSQQGLAAAQTDVTILRVPLVDVPVPNDCVPETVYVSGELQILVRTTVDAQGRQHIGVREQIKNAVAYSDVGNQYRVVGNTNLGLGSDWTSITQPFDSGATVLHNNILNILVPVRNSGGVKSFLQIQAHTTINANGEPSVETGDFKFICGTGAST